MNALELQDRIRIEVKGADTDPDYGTPLPDSWLRVTEVWAKIQDAKPGKTDATVQGLRLANDAATIWIRYREGITSDMRIIELTGARRTLSITGGPAAINGRRFLEFTVERFSS